MTDYEPIPFSRTRAVPVSTQIDTSRADPSTPWVWAVALLPGTPFLAALAIVMSLRAPIPLYALVLLIAIGIACTLGAAFADARDLNIRGFAGVADARWAIIPIVYLWRRTIPYRDRYQSNTPLWLHVIAVPVACFSFFFWALFLGAT